MSKLTKQITAMLLAGMLVIGSARGSVLAASTDVDLGQTSETAQEMLTEETSEIPASVEETSEIAQEVYEEETSEAPADAGETSQVEDTSEELAAVGETAEEASAEEETAAQYYTVTLDANGGYFENEWDDVIGDYAKQTEVVEKHIPVDGTVVALPVFTDQEGQTMVFAGWSLEKDGELITMGDEEYAPVDNCTLYAVWQVKDAALGDTEGQEVADEGTEQTNAVLDSEELNVAAEDAVTEEESLVEEDSVSEANTVTETETESEQAIVPDQVEVYKGEDIEHTSEDSSEATVEEKEAQPELIEASEEEEAVKEDAVNGIVASGTCGVYGDNLTGTLDEEGTLTISGIGEMQDSYFTDDIFWNDKKEEIKKVIIGEGVTSIGDSAFADCSNLKSVTIPESVTSIGNAAFLSCSSLTSVTIPGSVTWTGGSVFSNCSSLTNVTIPGSINWIGNFGFANCRSLARVIISEGVPIIDNSAFTGCSSLTSVTIPRSVTSINNNAFYNCSSLSDIYFSGNAPSIATNTFSNVIATAYYPPNDPTWTEDVRQNYGGNITWVVDTSQSEYFVIGRDSNKFPHGNIGVAEIGNERIGSSYPTSLYYYSKLLDGLKYTEQIELLDHMNDLDGWSGSCEGLSISLGMAYLKKIDLSLFDGLNDEAPTCYSELMYPSSDLDLRDLINYYQLLQDANKNNNPRKKICNVGYGIWLLDGNLTMYSAKDVFWQNFVNDVNEANAIKTPLLFSMNYYSSSQKKIVGHTILTCGYNESDKYHIIKFYDCNNTREYLYLFIDKSTYEFWFSSSGNSVVQIQNYASNDNWHGFEYFGADNWDSIDSDIKTGKKHYSKSENLNLSKSSNTYTYFTVNAGESFRLENNSGQYLEYSNNELNSTLDIYDFEIIGDSSKYRFKLAYDDNYNVTNINDSIKVCFRTDNYYLSALVDGADRINVNNGNSLVLEGSSLSYNVRMSMNTKDGLIELSGSASNSASIDHDGKNIIIESLDSSDVEINVYNTEGNISSNIFNGEDSIIIDESDSGSMIITSGSCGDNINWSLNDIGTLTITGTGRMADFPYSYGGAPWDSQNVKSVIIGNGITSIGNYAFCDSDMSSVSLPESLEFIGDFAFSGCEELQNVNIPDRVNFIGTGAFSGGSYKNKSKLTSITIGEGNTIYSENDGVVYNKNGDALLIYPPGKKGQFIIPNTVSTIGKNAFCGCTGLTSVIIPESVTTINDTVFVDSGITEITLPNSVKVLEDNVFNRCVYLKKVIIDAEISVLKERLFSACNALETIYLPESIIKIERDAFWDCRSLKDIFFSGSERTWSKVVIEKSPYDDLYILNATVHFAKENEISVLDESCTSIKVDDQIWTGKPLTPAVVVKYEDDSIIEGTDYEVSYANNTNVGTATVTITGTGYYTGTVTKTFKINGISIENATVTGISNKTYTGLAITQNPTVKVGDKTLTKNTDYTISYANNFNVGTATVTITGKGNYASKKTVAFKINKAAQSITAKAAASPIAVGKTTTVSITGNKGTKSFKSSDTTIATVSSTGKVTAKKVGKVTITATSAATANYKAASKTITIKVVPAATSSLTVENQATGIKLTWKKVTGANAYFIYRGSTQIAAIKNGSTVTYTDKKATSNGTKYTYKIIASASSTGRSTLSKRVTTYCVTRPAISTLNNSAASKMTVKWGKNAKATGYQIQYCPDKTFKTRNKSVSITSATTVSKIIGSLAKGKTYYVRIRTYKTAGSTKYFSAWSTVKSVKITK